MHGDAPNEYNPTSTSQATEILSNFSKLFFCQDFVDTFRSMSLQKCRLCPKHLRFTRCRNIAAKLESFFLGFKTYSPEVTSNTGAPENDPHGTNRHLPASRRERCTFHAPVETAFNSRQHTSPLKVRESSMILHQANLKSLACKSRHKAEPTNLPRAYSDRDCLTPPTLLCHRFPCPE